MKRVLLVEDSELVRSIIYDALQTCFPCIAAVAEDGARAWEELNSSPYDLVITDIMMPVMDGITLTKKIRKELDSDVPVIVMTSLNEDKVRQSASEAGASAFVPKPVDYNQLIQIVNNLVLSQEGPEEEDLILLEADIVDDEESEG